MAAPDYHNAHWFAVVYLPPLLAAQPGIYGISYDVFTRATEDPLPHGWEAARSKTYRRLISELRSMGFTQHQYSDYRHPPNITALQTWDNMASLRRIDPPGKLATTLRGLKMHRINLLDVFDVTDVICLGGHLSRQLEGPTPAVLVNNMAIAPLAALPQIVPPGTPLPPRDTKISQTSTNPANYLM